MSGTDTLKYHGIKLLCEMTNPPPLDSNVQRKIILNTLKKWVRINKYQLLYTADVLHRPGHIMKMKMKY